MTVNEVNEKIIALQKTQIDDLYRMYSVLLTDYTKLYGAVFKEKK